MVLNSVGMDDEEGKRGTGSLLNGFVTVSCLALTSLGS